MNLYYVRNLNDGISFWSREFACLRGTLDIKTQNTKWGNFAELALARKALYFVEIHDIKLNLAHALLLLLTSDVPVAFLNFDPSHPSNFAVNHEAE
jgi:hypothetical protein